MEGNLNVDTVMLVELKAYLNIAYEDELSDQALVGMVKRGKAVLDDYAGEKRDYEKEGLPRQLLFDYCRYARSHALEMFSVNFGRELIALREQAELEAVKEKDEDKDAGRVSNLQ